MQSEQTCNPDSEAEERDDNQNANDKYEDPHLPLFRHCRVFGDGS